MSHHGRNVSDPRSPAKSAAERPARRTASKAAPAGMRPPEDPHVEEIARTQAARPVKAGAGKHRGDRRDTSPTYTNNQKHAARGNTPRKDVKTRAR